MKKILLIFNILLCHSSLAQITLKECIENGLANKATIKSAKTEVLIANLQRLESKGKFLPQITLAYDYRYNPIIASQIVPVGQFSLEPSNETRAIQFGTNWQQNAGLTVYQPIIDLAIKSRFVESKINETLANIDLKKVEEDLTFEIVKTYSRILTLGFQVEESVSDTLRSFHSYSLFNTKFKEGKLLKTELNKGLVNHYANLATYKKALSLFINEKIYLHYLTNIDLERVLTASFTPIPPNMLAENTLQTDELRTENSMEFQKLLSKETLITQQIKTEKAKYMPTVGLQSFVGANQFSQGFTPFKRDSWFGNSYVGLSVKLSIFSPDKSINADKQKKNQLMMIGYQKEDLTFQKRKELLQIVVELERLQTERHLAQNTVTVLHESVKLYQERLQDGQFVASELNIQEADLQKNILYVKQLNEQFNKTLIEKLYITGSFMENRKKL
ncbi:TolC family protein [Arcicella rigui]|uniref:TolC family protein n=1 Tax=Arcicella rigui TaxID=797020 RepID=A0ABU5QE36_9BACT|nr:TolC family protein [Arcicella rigui]MEA5141096.1 TolC family protein [Arcicella rigui]